MTAKWEKIKAEYTAGSKLKDLSEKYKISIDTLRSRHRREGWSKLRTKTEQKTNNKIVEEISTLKAENDLDEVESIIKSIKKVDELIDSGNIEATSLEGLLDKKVKLLIVLGTYTGKTSEKSEVLGTHKVIPLLGGISAKSIEEKNEMLNNYSIEEQREIRPNS